MGKSTFQWGYVGKAFVYLVLLRGRGAGGGDGAV